MARRPSRRRADGSVSSSAEGDVLHSSDDDSRLCAADGSGRSRNRLVRSGHVEFHLFQDRSLVRLHFQYLDFAWLNMGVISMSHFIVLIDIEVT